MTHCAICKEPTSHTLSECPACQDLETTRAGYLKTRAELAAAIAERDRAKLQAIDSDRAHDARVTECERQADVIAELKAERDALARRVAALEGGKAGENTRF